MKEDSIQKKKLKKLQVLDPNQDLYNAKIALETLLLTGLKSTRIFVGKWI